MSLPARRSEGDSPLAERKVTPPIPPAHCSPSQLLIGLHRLPFTSVRAKATERVSFSATTCLSCSSADSPAFARLLRLFDEEQLIDSTNTQAHSVGAPLCLRRGADYRLAPWSSLNRGLPTVPRAAVPVARVAQSTASFSHGAGSAFQKPLGRLCREKLGCAPHRRWPLRRASFQL